MSVGRRGHVGDLCATVGQETELTGEACAASNHNVILSSAHCASTSHHLRTPLGQNVGHFTLRAQNSARACSRASGSSII